MDRRQKRDSDETKNLNFIVLIIGIVIAIIVVFILSYTLYSNKLSKEAKVTNIEKISRGNMLNVITNEENTSVSKSIGKSVNEVENEQSKVNQENTEKRAINTSIMENVVSANNTKSEETDKKIEENTTNENVEEQVQTSSDPTFIKPVDGDIIKDYSSDNLIYSNTLEEWTTHLGIDFKSEKTSIVKASADGTVKSIKSDPRYGLTVVLEHDNGFTSMYANLLSTEFITVGEKVTQGETIATVGNTATFEIADETHLHFEILKDGVNVDPNIYLK